jgi:hypothetical protein
MPYPHVTQLETRLSLGRVLVPIARPQPRRRRARWAVLLGLDGQLARNTGGRP